MNNALLNELLLIQQEVTSITERIISEIRGLSIHLGNVVGNGVPARPLGPPCARLAAVGDCDRLCDRRGGAHPKTRADRLSRDATRNRSLLFPVLGSNFPRF